MAKVSFRVVHEGEGWVVLSDEASSAPYATREAAFESTLGPASNAIRVGDEVVIVVSAETEMETLQTPTDTPYPLLAGDEL